MKDRNSVPGSYESITQKRAVHGLSLHLGKDSEGNKSDYKSIANQRSNPKYVVDSSSYIRYLKTTKAFRK